MPSGMWLARHIHPHGMTGFHTDEWEQAREWLRTMMRLTDPQGVANARTRLQQARRATPFRAHAGGDVFEIRAA